MNLLEHFALIGSQVTRLHAEVHRNPAPGAQIHAQIEIKVNPVKPEEGHAAEGINRINLGFRCVGKQKAEDDNRDALFTLECAMTAAYRQMRGEPLPFEQFTAHHSPLSRQLFPLLRQVVTPVLAQMGFANVQLPHDLFQNPGPENQSSVVENPPSVH